MSSSGWCRKGYIFFIVAVAFFAVVSAALGEKKEEKSLLSLADVDVRACEGVKITQCEVAKNLIFTLKMGEGLTCEASFIHLRALDIAPGEDWSYEEQNKIITPDEMKEVVLEVHRAYNVGNVRLDGFATAAGLNRFCQDLKGPSALPPKGAGAEEQKKEEGGQEGKKPAPTDTPLPPSTK